MHTFSVSLNGSLAVFVFFGGGLMSEFLVNNELNTAFINAIDQGKYADSFDSISVLVLAQIPTKWNPRKKL